MSTKTKYLVVSTVKDESIPNIQLPWFNNFIPEENNNKNEGETKYMVIATPSGALAPVKTVPDYCENTIGWIDNHLANDTLEGIWNFAGSYGGCMILNLSLDEDLYNILNKYPFGPYLNFQIEKIEPMQTHITNAKNKVETTLNDLAEWAKKFDPRFSQKALNPVIEFSKSCDEASAWINKQITDKRMDGMWSFDGSLRGCTILNTESDEELDNFFDSYPFSPDIAVHTEGLIPMRSRLVGLKILIESVLSRVNPDKSSEAELVAEVEKEFFRTS